MRDPMRPRRPILKPCHPFRPIPPNHRYAARVLRPWASAALATVHPSSTTRLTSTARLRGQLPAFLCRSILPSSHAAGFDTHSMPEVARMDHSCH